MMENSVWIENIKVGLMPLADPPQGFINYEFNKLYTMYRNFLQSIVVYLYDDMDLDDFLDKCGKEHIISKSAFEKLKQLDKVLNDFFEQAKELTEFELIRRKEWDIIIPLAQSCLNELS
jgi:hypothetical protein